MPDARLSEQTLNKDEREFLDYIINAYPQGIEAMAIRKLLRSARVLAEIERHVEDHDCLDEGGDPGPTACNECVNLWLARRRVAPQSQEAQE